MVYCPDVSAIASTSHALICNKRALTATWEQRHCPIVLIGLLASKHGASKHFVVADRHAEEERMCMQEAYLAAQATHACWPSSRRGGHSRRSSGAVACSNSALDTDMTRSLP